MSQAAISPPITWHAGLRRPRRAGEQLIISWNVAGLRGLLRRAPTALAELVAREQPDMICLQETKLQQRDEAGVEAALNLPVWTCAWNSSGVRLGQAGVATLMRQGAAAVDRGPVHSAFAEDGRIIVSRHAQFALVNVYVPNAGDGLKTLSRRLEDWDPMLADHLARLRRQGTQVILAGDLNVAPAPLDVHDPRTLVKYAGFTPEERASFAQHLLGQGLVDAFRHLHPEVRAYTFFSWRGQGRARSRGWRLDHFLLSPELMVGLRDCYIMPEVTASDHLPIGLRVAG